MNSNTLEILRDSSTAAAQAISVFSQARAEFYPVLAIAALFAGACWWAAAWYPKLWNLRFRVLWWHHLLCAFASLATYVFVVLFAALAFLKPAADLTIDAWKVTLLARPGWVNERQVDAYRQIRGLNLEGDFDTRYPVPSEANKYVVGLSLGEYQQKYGEVYAAAATKDFSEAHPFFSKLLWIRPEAAATLVENRMTEFFKTNQNERFDAAEALRIVGEEIKVQLQPQTGRLVPLARVALIGLFLLVQLVPFGIIGLAAYKDLKVTT